MVITPVDEVEAINEILSAIGATPVNVVDDSISEYPDLDVTNARRILYSVSREVQARGWAFNTEEGVFLAPNADTGRVPYLPTYLKVLAKGYQFSKREGYFFDNLTREDVFPQGLVVTLVRLLNFESLPEAFKTYITARSARLFQEKYMTSDELTEVLTRDELEAYSHMIDYELESGEYNIFSNTSIIQLTQRG